MANCGRISSLAISITKNYLFRIQRIGGLPGGPRQQRYGLQAFCLAAEG
jgi:hypothetical protein